MEGPEFLDVSRLPFSRPIGDQGFDLAEMIQKMYSTMQFWQASDLVKASDREGDPIVNFGFAMADPFVYYHQKVWNDPYELAWLVGGWGPLRDRYIANALRKMRAAAREGFNTLRLKHSPNHGDVFRDVVDSVENDGRFRWGDFPHGGAVSVEMGELNLLGAVSVYAEDEDGVVAATLLGFAGLHIHRQLTLPAAA